MGGITISEPGNRYRFLPLVKLRAVFDEVRKEEVLIRSFEFMKMNMQQVIFIDIRCHFDREIQTMNRLEFTLIFDVFDLNPYEIPSASSDHLQKAQHKQKYFRVP